MENFGKIIMQQFLFFYILKSCYRFFLNLSQKTALNTETTKVNTRIR